MPQSPKIMPLAMETMMPRSKFQSPLVSESILQAQIIRHLRSAGAYVIRIRSAQNNGAPDVIACHKGKFIGIEIKSPKIAPKPSPLQKENGEQIQETGGLWICTNSLSDVIALLDSIE